jgi:hypothetical protein
MMLPRASFNFTISHQQRAESRERAAAEPEAESKRTPQDGGRRSRGAVRCDTSDSRFPRQPFLLHVDLAAADLAASIPVRHEPSLSSQTRFLSERTAEPRSGRRKEHRLLRALKPPRARPGSRLRQPLSRPSVIPIDQHRSTLTITLAKGANVAVVKFVKTLLFSCLSSCRLSDTSRLT